MEIKWCWKCQMEIPMLNEEEFTIAQKLYGKGIRNLKYASDRQVRFNELLDYYKELTGFSEIEPNAIMHHRIENFGADCPKCKKPLRTKKARYCVECGFGKH